MIALLGRTLLLKLLGGLAAAAAVAAVLFGARQSGKTSARLEGLRDQIANVKARQDAETAVDRASDDERRRLRAKWTRR